MKYQNFAEALVNELESSICNEHENNYDIDLFGVSKTSIKQKVIRSVKNLLSKKLKKKLALFSDNQVKGLFISLQPYLSHRLNNLYQSLADQESKDLLVKIIAFRILGYHRIKLPLNTEHFWSQRNELKRIMDRNETISAGNWILQMADLSCVGYPIKMYYLPIGIQVIFVLKQYEYQSKESIIRAEKGDIVIDAGGCWGDTSLYFAYEVGVSGKVYTIECIPDNLKIMEKNFHLNSELETRIEIIRNPVWSKSDIPMYFTDSGPSSIGVLDENNNNGGKNIKCSKCSTSTIDDIVHRNQLREVNFIKMDIEGAEIEALRGAEKTIKQSQPKLAISVYHSMSDFVDVYEFISSLNLGYRFYLGHYTIHSHETILFAGPEKHQ